MIIIERTITIKNDKATLDSPIYLHVGDGDITCLFTINEMGKVARFGSIGKDGNKINIIDNNDIDYGRVRVFKPDETLAYTDDRSEIIDGKLQVILSAEWMDKVTEAGTHQLQIHLYDNKTEDKNRFTIPPVDVHVLPLVGSNTSLIDEAMVGYALLDQLSLEEETFIDGLYNKTEWEMGDIITQGKLNKIENALYQISTTDEEHEHPEYLTHIPDEYVTEYEMMVELNKKANNHHIHEGYLTSVPSHYVTESMLYSKDYVTQYYLSTNYAQKADLPKIPLYVSYFTNDAKYINESGLNTALMGYLTREDLLNYRYINTTDAIALIQAYGGSSTGGGTTGGGETGGGSGVSPETLANYVTHSQLDAELDAELDARIPTKFSQLEDDMYLVKYSTLEEFYVTKNDMPTKLSSFTNDEGFIKSDYVDAKVNEALFDKFIDISLYAKIEDVDNKDTELELLIGTKADNNHDHDDRYLREHQDLSSYPTRTEVSNALGGYSPADHTHSGYASATALSAVEAEIVNIESEITSIRAEVDNVTSEVTDIINTEISNINTSLEDKADKEHTHSQYLTQNQAVSSFATKSEIAGIVKSGTITRIEIVEELPEYEDPTVLYIVLA